MVLSFNPVFPGDRFIWISHWWDSEVVHELKRARAVVVPQTIPAMFYRFIQGMCPRVFPNYDMRFKWEGKVGDALLAWSLGIPHPKTVIFPRVVSLTGDHPEMGKGPYPMPPFPFVIKQNTGGEGSGTWLVKDREEFEQVVSILKREEMNGRFGFVVQEYIQGLDKTLRVVVIGEHIESYWRIGAEGDFYSNVSKGASIDTSAQKGLMGKGEEFVRGIIQETGINLAGFDIFFVGDSPHLLEINYTFGLRGLGGMERFNAIMRQEIGKWVTKVLRNR